MYVYVYLYTHMYVYIYIYTYIPPPLAEETKTQNVEGSKPLTNTVSTLALYTSSHSGAPCTIAQGDRELYRPATPIIYQGEREG